MAEGWRWGRWRFFKVNVSAKENKKICVRLCVFLTSWYTEGLEREGTVKDNILLCPSLSTMSCERGRQEDNEKMFLWARKTEAFFLCMPKTSKERVLISSSTLFFSVWVFVCVWTSGFPHLPPWGRCFAYAVCLFLCILHEHTRANPGVLVSPVCMLMSDGLMGASQCVEWQLTYSAIQRGS